MNWLKKYLIPHIQNDFKPHLFRKAGLVGMFTLVLILFAVAVSGPFIFRNTDLTALVLPRVLVDYTNNDRLAMNYPNLTINSTLQQAAQMKANDMANKGYFAHKSPEGQSPWYWFQKAGYDFVYAGENLAVNFTDSVDVNTAWMNSPGHKANILNAHFTEIGIATAEGVYQGRPTTFVVQLFGTPADTKVVVKNTTSVVMSTTTKPSVTTKSVLSTIASTSVLGESDVNELYVAVEDKSAVQGTTTVKSGRYASWIERVLVSPGKLLSFSYAVIAIVIIGGIISVLFVEIKKHHIVQIIISICILILMAILLYMYHSVLFAPLLIV